MAKSRFLLDIQAIKKNVLILILLFSGFSGRCCECTLHDLKTDMLVSEKIFAGKLIDVDSAYFQFLVFKVWKGSIKSDTFNIRVGDRGNCMRGFLGSLNEYLMIFSSAQGISTCSRTMQYNKSADIDELDKQYQNTIWINDKYLGGLEKLEYDRKFIIDTYQGPINIEGKKVICNFKGKVVKMNEIPLNFNYFYPIRYFLVASKNEIVHYNNEIDYVIYIDQVHQDHWLSETKRKKILRRSLQKAKFRL